MVWLLLAIVTTKVSSALAREEQSHGELKNVQAFASFCQQRKRAVHKRVAPAAGTTMMVRIEQGFPGGSISFNASPIHHHMERRPAICEKTGLHFLEGIYHGKHLPEKKRAELELHRFRMCSAEQPSVGGESPAGESRARYELVLGETVDKRTVPWGGGPGGRWMSSSSVRLVDLETGATLAEDTMFFLSYDSGVGGCPEGLAQLASLIADVFPSE